MKQTLKKPGWMKRAIVAWFVLNTTLAAVLYGFIWLLAYADIEHRWYTIIPLMLVFFIGEVWIINETIGPVLYKVKEWIFQEESIDRSKGEKPSWEK